MSAAVGEVGEVVKTVEELAALPAGTILADNGGWPFWRDRLRGWCAANGSHDVDPETALRDGGPFTVLYRPGAIVVEIEPRSESVVAAEVLEMTARALQMNTWVDLIKGGPLEQRIGNAQRVVDWLRARARALSEGLS